MGGYRLEIHALLRKMIVMNGLVYCFIAVIYSLFTVCIVAQDPMQYNRYEGIEVKINDTKFWDSKLDELEGIDILLGFMLNKYQEKRFSEFPDKLVSIKKQVLNYALDTSIIAYLDLIEIQRSINLEMSGIQSALTFAMTEEDRIEFRPLIADRLARHPSCDFTPVYKPGKISPNFRPFGRIPQLDMRTGKNVYLIEPVPVLSRVVMQVRLE